MFHCYILHSQKLDRFYVGATRNLDDRIKWHNDEIKNEGDSKRGIPWTLFHSIECETFSQALKIEAHIKRMKSKVYIKNLKKYPEMNEKLLTKYA